MSLNTTELRLMVQINEDIKRLSRENQRVLLAQLAESFGGVDLGVDPLVEDEGSGMGSAKNGHATKAQPPPRPPKAGRKLVPGGVTDLAVKAVLSSPTPLGAADVLAVVQRARPTVQPSNVYTSLMDAANKGLISKELGKGNRAAYSKPTQGKATKHTK